MEQIKRILVADDLAREKKEIPSAVVNIASDLAQSLGAVLDIMHVYDLPDLTVPNESMILIEGPYVEAMTKAIESERETIERERPGLSVNAKIEKGKPVNVLLNDVKGQDYQLMVVGTHGRSGVKRAFLGSVAEELIRRSPVPVLTISPHTEVRTAFRPNKVIVPIDFSGRASDSAIIDAAAEFSRQFKSPLVLLHVIEEWVYPIVQSASLLAGGFIFPLERELEEQKNMRFSQLTDLAKPLQERGLQVEVKLVERATSVSGAIIQAAESEKANLIVMGHRDASRLEYAFLGSVSRQVVRDAQCPVLTVAPFQSEEMKKAG